MFANTSKNGNSGNTTWYFNVSSTLLPVFTQPPANTEYSANSGISPIPQIAVYNIRNELLSYTVNVNLTCPNGEFSLGKSNGLYYNVSADCRSSSSVGSVFCLTTAAADSYNNTGNESLPLRTRSVEQPSDGGGGAAGGCVPTPKNCSDGLDNDCDGFVDCGDSDCASDPVCIARITDFNFTLKSHAIEITRGENGTVIGSLANMGNMGLNLSSSITKECCEVSIDREFHLHVKGETDFSVVIHVPLYTELREYLLTIGIGIGGLEKTKSVNIIVLENPLISSLNNLEKSLPELVSMIEEYARAGVDVGALKEKIGDIEDAVSDSNVAIEENDLEELRALYSRIETDLNSLESGLAAGGVQKFLLENKWNIAGLALICFFASFFITQLIIPLYRLRKEIGRLTEEGKIIAKTEESTEAQYFTRRIDKATYLKIITNEHNRLLEIGNTKNEMTRKSRAIVKPRYLAGQLVKFPLLILRKLKNEFKKLVRRGKRPPKKPEKEKKGKEVAKKIKTGGQSDRSEVIKSIQKEVDKKVDKKINKRQVNGAEAGGVRISFK